MIVVWSQDVRGVCPTREEVSVRFLHILPKQVACRDCFEVFDVVDYTPVLLECSPRLVSEHHFGSEFVKKETKLINKNDGNV